jgi:DNA-binding GntR family transcriptional regulator
MTEAEQIAEALRDGIIAGRIPAGTSLTQRFVAEHFKVSTTPARDAIRNLMSSGLVIAEGPKTFTVTSLQTDDFLDVMELRLLLEPRALELSIPYLSAREFEAAEEVLAQSRPEETAEAAAALHQRFHQIIYSCCKRRRLLQLIDAQHDHLKRYLIANWLGMGDPWAEAERGFLAIIRARQSAKAIAYLRRDIEGTVSRVLQVNRP